MSEKNEHLFDDIRPYFDSEVNGMMQQLLKEQNLLNALKFVFPERNIEAIVDQMSQIRSVKQFQTEIISLGVNSIARSTTKGLTIDGLENFEKGKAYLVISNHRDIVLDSAFLNFLLFSNDYETTRIAIGDNLLKHNWIAQLVKLNKNFIVRRGLSPRDMLQASNHLSAYIRHSIVKDNESVWIAQREGRTKDGDDKTAHGLIKMFSRSAQSNQSAFDAYAELNIIPLSISYEWEPCDVLKAKENIIKRNNEPYIKKEGEDAFSMIYGIKQAKGRVHFSFGKPYNHFMQWIDRDLSQGDLQHLIIQYIDKTIIENYRLFPSAYISYDTLHASRKFIEMYNQEDLDAFDQYLNQWKDETDFAEIKQELLRIYAKPVENKLMLKAPVS